ncbi:hypothetical protein [Azotobacter beijerinckii]|uniref:Replication region DNA-binding N-term n=1 Tax=Azotobacter beijerinckii TaxID=170623 RepID=A0A1I0Z494_9GAMM|nr:hypothetical protein [Azotobacter beijerinckii]SFB20157.1 hypothetical protein SAMN04244571_01772 [Azotobacter beijerinckii]
MSEEAKPFVVDIQGREARECVFAADHDRIVAGLQAQIERAVSATNAECNDWAREHELRMKVTAERNRLEQLCRELEEDLIITEEERDSSRRNVSAFENAMGEAQQEAGRLRDERDTLRAEADRLAERRWELRAHERERNAARATLEQLGYTYHGGEQWKPPLGPRPNFDLLDLRDRTIAQLEQSRDGMRDEVERLRRDAERYRWLRDHGATASWEEGGVEIRSNPGHLDDAVDESIAVALEASR